jgi:hypothetical protein
VRASAAAEVGGILVRVQHDGPRILACGLQFKRPLEVVRVALGRAPSDFLRMLPMIFPLCGMAHAVAALRAVESAAGIVPDAAHEAARDLIALADAAAAHVWRLSLDWTVLAGLAPDPAPVAAARRAAESCQRALYPAGDWLRPGGGGLAAQPAALDAARQAFGAIFAQLELQRTLIDLRGALALALAGASPEWVPRLHGCLRVIGARMAGDFVQLLHGLVAQREARAPAGPAMLVLGDGSGSGECATARGPLRYSAELRNGVVIACAVDAPAERAFGPGGEASRWLASLTQAARPELAARWVVAALDPCAPVRVEACEVADA